ncbi:MAG: transposase [Rehaibacterium terrae]|uniref:transposase n=1 Tax=Rehaibacterium terrae TaxID=1341696 RepID=UPI00391C206A
MTQPRRHIVDPATAGFYHCVSRCVRRAFLCGFDTHSGQSFEHRKAWVEERLLELAECFAVGLYAYAVMSNHLHVVLYADPGVAHAWSAEEVAERWTRLFPVREGDQVNEEATRLRAEMLAGNPERIAELRERLGSVSWFMRCLNEPIARRANREDGCTGRFWEGRFKCQALLDDQAVLACMAYVDLNPIRAGIAPSLEASEYTSVVKRLICGDIEADQPLLPVAGRVKAEGLPLTLPEYLALTDWTGRIARADKRGAIVGGPPAALRHLGIPSDQWQDQVFGIETRYWRAVGAVEALLAKARELGQCWLKGAGVMRKLERARVH